MYQIWHAFRLKTWNLWKSWKMPSKSWTSWKIVSPPKEGQSCLLHKIVWWYHYELWWLQSYFLDRERSGARSQKIRKYLPWDIMCRSSLWVIFIASSVLQNNLRSWMVPVCLTIKVSKFQKQIFVLSFEPKNERNYFWILA